MRKEDGKLGWNQHFIKLGSLCNATTTGNTAANGNGGDGAPPVVAVSKQKQSGRRYLTSGDIALVK